MKKNKGKIISVLLIMFSIISIGINAYGHSGRTDSSGGHRDNKNKSGLGSYHYHCGGYPAHLHKNGVCPYSPSSSKKSQKTNTSSSKPSSNSKTTTSSKKTTSTKPTTIEATKIQINENIKRMTVGKNEKLTATITPYNTSNKNITWKSSDETIATVNTMGEITAKRPGNVNITASTTNGKTSTITISIEEKEQRTQNNTEINNTIKNSMTSQNITVTNNIKTNKNNTEKSNEEESNPIGIILALGLIGGGSYWGYNKYKKRN